MVPYVLHSFATSLNNIRSRLFPFDGHKVRSHTKFQVIMGLFRLLLIKMSTTSQHSFVTPLLGHHMSRAVRFKAITVNDG